MNPNNRTNLPSTQTSSDLKTQVNGIDDVEQSTTSPEDELFILKPPAKKPLNKKAVAGVVVLTILGVGLLVAVLVFALIASASGLANDYKRLAFSQLKKIDAPLKELEPSSILNKRDLDSPLATISLSEQSQPRLENVLFIGSWSSTYVKTAKIEQQIHAQYRAIGQYAQNMKTVIVFDDKLQSLSTQEAQVVAAINPSDSLSIRSLGGSFEGFAKQINDEPVPSSIRPIKTDLVKIYRDKAGIYLAWAKALEANDGAGQAKAQQELTLETAKITPLIDDQNYTRLLTSSYKSLLDQQKLLETRLRT